MCTERYDLSTGQRSESTRSRLRMAAGRDRCLFLSIWDHLPRKFERKLRIRQRHTQGKERTAGFLAAAPGFRPTLPPPAPPLSQIFSLSLSLSLAFLSLHLPFRRIFFLLLSFSPDLFLSSLGHCTSFAGPPSALPSSSSVAATALQSALPADGNSSS